MTTGAIVPAAGRGERLGAAAPKALVLLGGRPLLAHAVEALLRAPSIADVVVVAPPDAVDEVRALLVGDPVLAGLGADAVSAVHVVAGGATRQASVAAGLAALPDTVDIVLVHDAARALAPVALIESVAAAVRVGADAVVPAIAVADTVKTVDAVGRVVGTPERSRMRAVQTPQGFSRDVLGAAHASAAADAADETLAATDDAGLVERLGRPVHVVPGSEEAFKVTRPLDLVLAEAVLASRRTDGGRA